MVTCGLQRVIRPLTLLHRDELSDVYPDFWFIVACQPYPPVTFWFIVACQPYPPVTLIFPYKKGHVSFCLDFLRLFAVLFCVGFIGN